ncbi:helix-turn-helix domain-containing protein [Streptomyces sp. SAI-229]|uniref:helix-turn-helix domain-containing protein n=1 Tax=Streptomyces sp. SAI-229 TaxID=3377731 RepID=UPI003C7E8B3A
MLDVHQLRVLTEVARTGSCTAAAASLSYTQPPVSYQMRRLQQSVGAPLVVRNGRGRGSPRSAGSWSGTPTPSSPPCEPSIRRSPRPWHAVADWSGSRPSRAVV